MMNALLGISAAAIAMLALVMWLYGLDFIPAVRKLDRIKPGWARMADLDSLNMNDPSRCLLHQLFKDDRPEGYIGSGYGYAVQHLGIKSMPFTSAYEWLWRPLIKWRQR